MPSDDLDAAVAASRAAVQAMGRGDPRPTLALWSRRDDAVLANPLKPAVVGWTSIEAEVRRVAATFTGVAEPMGFEEVARVATPDMGYVIAFESGRVQRPGSAEFVSLSLRVTTVFRREADGWKLVLRHADRSPADPRRDGVAGRTDGSDPP